VYPTLEAATAASASALLACLSRKRKEHAIAAPPPRDDTAPASAAGRAHHCQDLLDKIVRSLFDAGLSLDAAAGKPQQAASQQVAQALQLLDDAIRDIRNHVSDTHVQGAQSCLLGCAGCRPG